MMLEQSLISPNFLGKESFRWFVGLVTKYISVPDTDPEKIGSGFKAKVRIIGYHPDSKDVIPEEELPWAHVLVPLTMGSGNGGNMSYHVPQGGETVIGFFIDGDNGQQPVIIGSLGCGYNIDHPNNWNEGTNGFVTFQRNIAPLNTNNKSVVTGRSTDQTTNSPQTPRPDGQVSRTGENGEQVTDRTQAQEAVKNDQQVTIPPICNNSNTTYSKIVQALRKFIKTLNTIQQVQNGFISPALNTLANVPGLVQELTTTLTDLFSEYLKQTRDRVLIEVYKWLEGFINSLLPKDIKILKQIATDKIADSIWCAFSKALKALGEFIFNFVNQLIGAVTNIPICAAEAFVGSIMSTISNEIGDALAPILNEFSSSLSGTIGQINNIVFQALNYANQALNFLSCEGSECKEVLNYEMNKGYIKQQTIDDVQRILNYPSQGIQDGKTAAQQWLGIVGAGSSDYSYLSSSYGYCDALNLDCGLPTVEFFGGGGSGATGLAVVDAIGQLMGINLINSGTGYANPPYVSIEDPCGNGTGASATTEIEDGKVVKVIVDNPGSGYLGPGTSTDPCATNPVDQSGSEVVGYIVGVKIIKTGIGYQSSDLIFNNVCDSDVEIYPIIDPSGRIVDVNIVNPGTAIRVFPELQINSQDGQGAILQPILSFKPIETTIAETDKNKIKKVILCAEDHGI